MDYQIIDCNEFLGCLAGGVYGKYWNRKDGTGIKIIKEWQLTVGELLSSEEFQLAKREVQLLKIAEFTGLTPKCYGLVLVRQRSVAIPTGVMWFVGIHMQHIEGKRMEEHPEYSASWGAKSRERGHNVKTALGTILTNMGIYHGDMHGGNIMVTPEGRFYVIDFTPCSIELKKETFRVGNRIEDPVCLDMDMEHLRTVMKEMEA